MPMTEAEKKKYQAKFRAKPAKDKPKSEPPPPEIYFNQAKANYMVKNHHGEWMGLTEASIGRVLRSKGFAGLKRDGSDLDDKEKRKHNFMIYTTTSRRSVSRSSPPGR